MLMNRFEVEISALLVSYPSVPDYYILHLKCLDYRGVSIEWGVPISDEISWKWVQNAYTYVGKHFT